MCKRQNSNSTVIDKCIDVLSKYCFVLLTNFSLYHISHSQKLRTSPSAFQVTKPQISYFSRTEDFNHLEYTALVPTDESIMAALEAHRQSPENSDSAVTTDSADPFLEDDEARNRLVGGHILKGRYSLSSLRPGMTVTTLLNDTLTVTAASGEWRKGKICL